MSIPGIANPPPLLLFGRVRELAVLRETHAAQRDGQGRLTLISGEAGIGKTVLAEALCHEAAAQGTLVLIGRCYDLTETPPYGLWIELFGRYRRMADALPLPPVFAVRGTVGAVTGQAALFQEVRDFFVALAEQRPIVLLLDDLHWSDPASLDLLRFLARDLANIPLLVLATYRRDELASGHPLAHLLPALARESRALHLDLYRWEAADVRALVDRYGFPDADRERLVAHLFKRAEGNPFFTEEILRTLEEGRMLRSGPDGWTVGDLARAHVPPLVRQVIEGRLARLNSAARLLLAVAAVIGQEVPLTLWARVAGVPEDALLATIETATAAHLMEETPDGTGMQFAHALIRETLYEGIPLPMRRDRHHHVAAVLIASGNPDADAVANHLRRAGDPGAIAWLVRAGERAYRAYAFLTAAERFAAALQMMDEQHSPDLRERGWVLYRLSVVNRFADPWHGVEHLNEALQCAAAVGDEVLQAYTLISRSNKYNLTGDLRKAFADYEASAIIFNRLPTDAQPEVGMPGMWKITRGSGGPAFYEALAGSYASALDRIERLVGGNLSSPPPDVDYGTDGMIAHTAAIVHAAMGRIQPARFASDHAYEAYCSAGQFYPAVMGRLHELHSVLLPCLTDRVAERRVRTVMAEEEYQRIRDVHADPHPQLIRLPLRVIEGEWDEARELALLWMDTRPVGWQRPFYAAAGTLALAQGDWDMGRRLIADTFPDGPDMRPGGIWFDRAVAVQRLAASFALVQGDLSTAHAWLVTYDRWLAWSGAVIGLAEQALLWATWHRMSGDHERANEQAERALAHASEPRQPLARVAAYRLLGELAIDLGQLDSAAAYLQAALALADVCAAPYEQAQTLYAQATLAHARNNHAAALESLADVQTICTRLGARPLLVRADALIAQIGVTSPAAYPGGLTAREIDVLRLAAQGMNDQAIAAQLSLSAHTIHRHMANIRTKLDLPSRTAAVAYALRHGLL